eukprot:12035856-Alexandrium_andersonii.AAC.1
MSDATQAYTQARLKGKLTWVRLPEREWPEEWEKNGMRDPVAPLLLAIYGHPDAGGGALGAALRGASQGGRLRASSGVEAML